MRWDIFCVVIDNFGDIGVCWRLARQLASEHHAKVRIWVDNLSSLQRIWPAINPEIKKQVQSGVEVNLWAQPFQDAEPADIVIEAFGCNIPESYISRMAALAIKPLWINLEYLSAEAWVDEYHALPSYHPFLPLVKYFFFPGFSSHTGGLLRETKLEQRRLGFLADISAVTEFWNSIGLQEPPPETLCISLFSYENRALPMLLEQWKNGKTPVHCLFFDGNAAQVLKQMSGHKIPTAGNSRIFGNLQITIMNFLPQDQYDKLLWLCDCNFVRGEDSFVRAQWAGKPMTWQIYPQEKQTRQEKLSAFLDIYCQNLVQPAADALKGFWTGWCEGCLDRNAWEGFWENRSCYEQHARNWLEYRLRQRDFTTSLVSFCKNKLI